MAKPQVKKSLETFNQELAEVHMTGQWIYEDLLNRAIGGPRPRGDAYLWPWPMVHEKLLEACNVLEESFTARRSVLFGNPGLNDNATTHTLLMGIQMIKPGEIAWAHRHTLAAIRFVIKGDGKVFTVVDGEKCPMEPYDLILTPQWTWHDHRNPTQESAIWVDALDVPFLARTESAILRALSRQQSSDDSREGRRSFAAARRRRATDMGKHQERKSAAALRLERYRAAIARARRSARQSLRRRGAGVCESDDRRPYAPNAQLLDSIAPPRRAHEKASPHVERGLLRRRRRGHEHRRRQGAGMDEV